MEKCPPPTDTFTDVQIVEEKEHDYDDMDEIVDDRYNPENRTIPVTVIIPEPFRSKQRDNRLVKLDMNLLFSIFYDPDLKTQKPKLPPEKNKHPQ